MLRQSLPFVIAFASGGLLTLLVLFNGQWMVNGTALLASWMPHTTGMIVALGFLTGLRLWGTQKTVTESPPAPLWAYLGGLSGALTVMLTSTTVNGVLALSGTLALGLVGQAGYSLLADRYGWFGLPKQNIGARDWAALGLILSGSFLIIFSGGT